MSKTALIAGQGALPGILAKALADQGAAFCVAEMEGFPTDIPGHDPIRFRIERLVPFLERLADEGRQEDQLQDRSHLQEPGS